MDEYGVSLKIAEYGCVYAGYDSAEYMAVYRCARSCACGSHHGQNGMLAVVAPFSIEDLT